MLSYELCKKLRNANFPRDWADWDNHDQELLKINWEIYYYAPTLEELIEACGRGFKILVRGLMVPRDMVWRADSVNDKTGFGDTPDEAVANLWLSRKKS